MSDLGNAYSEVAVAWGEAAADVYSDVCTIKRKQAVSGSATLANIHVDVPCSDPKPKGGGQSADAIRGKTTYLIEMPASINGTTLNTVQTEDFLVVAARGIQPVRTYKVQAVEQDRGIKVFARCTIES